jgi:hypothetical protein
MTIHIMLDIETWGLRPGSDIRSIGACVFDPVAGIINVPLGGWKNSDPDSKLFYLATDNPIVNPEFEVGYWVSKEDHKRWLLRRDPGTVQWWNDQSTEAQSAFANPIDLRDACIRFSEWLDNVQGGGATDDKSSPLRIWANDPHFDCVLLAEAFHAVGLPVPWHYRAPRSVKTVTELAGMTSADFCNYGDAHNALHDAIAQAMTVCEAYRHLELNYP